MKADNLFFVCTSHMTKLGNKMLRGRLVRINGPRADYLSGVASIRDVYVESDLQALLEKVNAKRDPLCRYAAKYITCIHAK